MEDDAPSTGPEEGGPTERSGGLIVPVEGEFLLNLLNEVGRHRALTDTETDVIEEIVRAESGEQDFRWTARHDRMLIDASQRRGIHRLARDLGVSDGAAYQRLARVRRRRGIRVRGEP